MTITYDEAVAEYYAAASKAHEFTRDSAEDDAGDAHEALTAIRACIADSLGRFMERAHGACFGQAEINDAIEYATDQIGENLDGPAGLLFRYMNAAIRAKAAKAPHAAEAA